MMENVKCKRNQRHMTLHTFKPANWAEPDQFVSTYLLHYIVIKNLKKTNMVGAWFKSASHKFCE